MYKALKKTALIYIWDELSLYESKRSLRSSYAGPWYTISVGCKEVSDFDFAIKGPRVWKSLLIDLRRYDLQEKTGDIPVQKTILFERLRHKRFDWLQNQKGAI